MPEYLSGDKLYQYLHISKRKMKYLLENGYIPFTDTGKKTHRYLVSIEDAEAFRLRMIDQPDSLSELKGMFSSRTEAPTPPPPHTLEPTEENCKAFRRYLASQWRKLPDALPVPEAAKLIVMRPARLIELIGKGRIAGARIRSVYYCSKRDFIAFCSSEEMVGRQDAPEAYAALIEGFNESRS